MPAPRKYHAAPSAVQRKEKRMSTQFYYTASQMMVQAGRKSPNAAHQMMDYMPVPDAVIVAPRVTKAWTLATWRAFARTRSQPLQDDLLKTIERLHSEELDLQEQIAAHEPRQAARSNATEEI